MISALHNEISRLFSELSLVAALMAAAGFCLIAVELFQSTRSVASFCGALLSVAGITLEIICDGTEGTFFLAVELYSLALYVVHIIMLRFCKRDWLMQSAYLNVSHVEADRPLVGLTGVAETDFDGFGRIMADGLHLFAASDEDIKAGDGIRITKVVGDKVFVAGESLKKD